MLLSQLENIRSTRFINLFLKSLAAPVNFRVNASNESLATQLALWWLVALSQAATPHRTAAGRGGPSILTAAFVPKMTLMTYTDLHTDGQRKDECLPWCFSLLAS